MNRITKRDDIEWLNFWWEDASIHKKTVLCVGASVLRQVRGELQKQLGIKCSYFGSSAAYEDPALYSQLKYFFSYKEYKYYMCIVQITTHAFKMSQYPYTEKVLDRYFSYLRKYCKKIYVISLLHMTELDSQKEDDENNQKILEINELTRQYCQKEKIPYIDLYNTMKNSGFKHVDKVHFERASDAFFAEKIVGFVHANKVIQKQWGCLRYIKNSQEIEIRLAELPIFRYRKK